MEKDLETSANNKTEKTTETSFLKRDNKTTMTTFFKTQENIPEHCKTLLSKVSSQSLKPGLRRSKPPPPNSVHTLGGRAQPGLAFLEVPAPA